jgi:hypothetical protein
MLYSQFMPPTIISSITNTLVITEIMSMARHHLWNKRNLPIHRTIHIAYLSNILVGNCLLLATISSYPLPHSFLSTTVPTYNTKYCRVNSGLHSAALFLGNNSPIKNIHNTTDARVNNMEDSMTQLSTDSILEVVNRQDFWRTPKRRHDPSPSQSIVPDIILSKQSIKVIQSNMLNTIVAVMDDKRLDTSFCSDQHPTPGPRIRPNLLSESLQGPMHVATIRATVWSLPVTVNTLCHQAMSNVGDDPYYFHMHQATSAVCDVAGTLGCFDRDYYYQTNCHASSNKNSNYTKNSAVVGTTPAATAATGDETERAEAVLAPIEEEGDLHRLQVAPTIVTAGIELNEWAVSITFVNAVHPSSQLRALLDEFTGSNTNTNTAKTKWHKVVFSSLNKTLLRLSQEHASERAVRKAPLTLLGCCSVCVTKAFDFMRPMPLDSILCITCSSAYEYLEGFRNVRSITFR